jgi:polysaccharide biosynthesis protein PelC
VALLSRRLLLAGVAGALAACAGAASTQRDFVAEQPPRRDLSVAVLPFENLSAHPHAGQIIAQLVATELYNRRLFRQMEESEVRRRLVEKRLDGKELGRETVAREIADALDVDAVLVGSVQDFGYRYGLKPDPAVAAAVRLVGRDGVVLWGGSFGEVGASSGAGDTVTATAQRLAATIADRLQARTAPPAR